MANRVRVKAHTRRYPRARTHDGCPLAVLVLLVAVGLSYLSARHLERGA